MCPAGSPRTGKGQTVELVIRPYSESDFEAVSEVWFTSWQSVGVNVPDPALRTTLRERLPLEIANGWAVHVAVIGPDVVGFLALHGNRLAQLFVAPAMQGQGIGKQLLDFAKAERPDGFYLTTQPIEGPACRFYEREGLRRGPIGTHPKYGHPNVRYDWPP